MEPQTSKNFYSGKSFNLTMLVLMAKDLDTCFKGAMESNPLLVLAEGHYTEPSSAAGFSLFTVAVCIFRIKDSLKVNDSKQSDF